MINDFCTALFSGVHKLTFLVMMTATAASTPKARDDVTGHGHQTKQINVSVYVRCYVSLKHYCYDRCYMGLNTTVMTDVTWARTLLL